MKKKPKAGVSPKKKKPRRTQPERRDATRARILDATLYCLARYGYAGTGVAQVVARARVSRGAWSHHFASMDALILEAAQTLMARVYERLGVMLSEVSKAEQGMRGVVLTAWREFYASEVNEVYLELLIASRRDAKLAQTLRSLSGGLEQRLGTASTSFFSRQSGAVCSPTEVMLLNRWVLRGIALDAALMPEGGVEHALDAWSKLVESQIRAGGRS